MQVGLGVVAHNSNGCTNLANVIFVGLRHLQLGPHRVTSVVTRVKAKEQLHHCTVGMFWHAVISSRFITKEGVHSMPLIEAWDISCRES